MCHVDLIPVLKSNKETRTVADLNDLRRIALSLPETTQEEGHIAFAVMNKGKPKGIAWVWLERIDPKQAAGAQPRGDRHSRPQHAGEGDVDRGPAHQVLHRTPL